jgi:hypothetical protein
MPGFSTIARAGRELALQLRRQPRVEEAEGDAPTSSASLGSALLED